MVGGKVMDSKWQVIGSRGPLIGIRWQKTNDR